MGMYCYQCQEAAKNVSCTITGVCGKDEEVAKLQDMLIYLLKGISIWAVKARELGVNDEEVDLFVVEGLFATITNVNFDDERFVEYINRAFEVRENIKNGFFKAYQSKSKQEFEEPLHDAATWYGNGKQAFLEKAVSIGILSEKDEDIRSLKELLIYGIKGIAAYVDHAYVLKHKSEEIFAFVETALAETTRNDITVDELLSLVLKTGEMAVKTMELLDKAHTTTYGNPEITEVYTGTLEGPAILVSGHDLLDLEELLKQAEGKGINIYTHSEML
ncbi:MAG: hydroxylamine reductase, partial [Thermodesulfobacteriota bacterium]